MADANPSVVLAVVGAAHGIRGEVRVKTFLADPMDLGAYGPLNLPDGRVLTVANLRPLKDDMVVARFAEVPDRNAAEALNGFELSVPRERLPDTDDEDTFYHTDLIGLRAETTDGARLGSVHAIHDFGAGSMLEIHRHLPPSLMIPFTKANVPVIDIAGGRIIIVPPPEVEGEKPGRG